MTNIRPDAAEESEFCHFVTTDTMTYPMFHMTSSDSYMNDTEIITLVKKYWQADLCTNRSKALWRVLHNAGLYKAGYTNWNGLMNKP